MPRVTEEYFVQKRKEIIEAAYRVCTRKPIASVGMQDIINETGFSHGVIYKYYKDLDEVIRDLVGTINSEHRLDERISGMFDDTENWTDTIRKACRLLADQMTEAGFEVLKISLYGDMLAMSNPERVLRIAETMDPEKQSPLVTFMAALTDYLNRIIAENDLHPQKAIEEIMQFMTVTYQGIQSGYVLANSLGEGLVQGQYDPHKMFACLAESVILLLETSAEET